VIQAIYKGIEIEMEMHQHLDEQWRCDFTLIKHPERTMTIHHGTETFQTLEIAREHTLKEAQDAIDRSVSIST
jgi:hypothetical protein